MKNDNDLIKELPEVSEFLLKYLSRVFEEKSPDGTETHQELMIRAGEAKVTRHLRYIHNLQFNTESCASLNPKLPQRLLQSFKLLLLRKLLRSL